MKYLTIIAFTALLISSCSAPKGAQESRQENNAEKQAKIREIVTARNFVFKAQMALPMSGRTRQLTSEYDLQVSKDTIVAYLPYFGRAYSAPISSQGGGIQFTSTKFEYTSTDKNKGWDILIKTNGSDGTDQLNLSISESGYASLQVTNTNRQPISFNGYIEERKKK